MFSWAFRLDYGFWHIHLVSSWFLLGDWTSHHAPQLMFQICMIISWFTVSANPTQRYICTQLGQGLSRSSQFIYFALVLPTIFFLKPFCTFLSLFCISWQGTTLCLCTAPKSLFHFNFQTSFHLPVPRTQNCCCCHKNSLNPLITLKNLNLKIEISLILENNRKDFKKKNLKNTSPK